MRAEMIDIDVRLLILRYGRGRVLQVVARLGDQTLEELELLIKAVGEKPKPGRAQPSLIDLVNAQARERPEIGEPLRSLIADFGNRTFLPQLRDVQKFLERSGVTNRKLRSRAAAAPALIRALGKFSIAELERLKDDKPGSDSEYSLLARAIMGAPPAKPPGSGETR